jgi:hypothetical protein
MIVVFRAEGAVRDFEVGVIFQDPGGGLVPSGHLQVRGGLGNDCLGYGQSQGRIGVVPEVNRPVSVRRVRGLGEGAQALRRAELEDPRRHAFN